MSSRPNASASESDRAPITLPGLRAMKAAGEPVVMVTAYDYPSAVAAEHAEADIVLVGDSGAMTVLGYDSTVPATLDEMLMLTRAVRRGLRTPILIGDLPFGSYEVSDEQAIETSMRFVKEGGCHGVKLERGGRTSVARARAIVDAGIPVMGHVGLTPQTATALGGYKAQGRTGAEGATIVEQAAALQDAGCFSIVLECIPSPVTEALMPRINSSVVIGIGAGPATDGQVLVFHDLLGIREGKGAKFVKRYADLQDAMDAGVRAYAEEVRSRAYPAPEHGYAMTDDEIIALKVALDDWRHAG
ncbi:3-methyl-2-oxobutanoate hydroxymethyltransferase [Luteipulveratus mongoliensis]|uniref:3-methyl-2-oxobutanoate hydroxymethyltransferase n=1 Tax=Luteipulveratus mongoliensis TaxID=571913 RepID=A0A0K1JDY4_9MICO|nr:3-methyl-2-oxobutanoate hydroxymethyltransferase [Luteipulveratus mongoliensis]AKU14795.1 3-methyl-2-oxobutanoate hydroxymethyltransferase [Luteipulveratus mongoliensis]